MTEFKDFLPQTEAMRIIHESEKERQSYNKGQKQYLLSHALIVDKRLQECVFTIFPKMAIEIGTIIVECCTFLTDKTYKMNQLSSLMEAQTSASATIYNSTKYLIQLIYPLIMYLIIRMIQRLKYLI